MEMPIISLWNPWAIWVGLGWKTIETRTHQRFACLVGRTIGIHAALKWDDTAINAARQWLTDEQVRTTQRMLRIGGAICWTAEVFNFLPLGKMHEGRALIECQSVQRYGLFLTNVKAIEIIPCRGKQGIWYQDVPTE